MKRSGTQVWEVLEACLSQCCNDLRRLRVAWFEVKLGAKGRLVAYNPTGFQFKVELIPDLKPPMPYAVLNRIQRKRMYAQVGEKQPPPRRPTITVVNSGSPCHQTNYCCLFQRHSSWDPAGSPGASPTQAPALAD